jgi:two-component system, cell cycle response regulator
MPVPQHDLDKQEGAEDTLQLLTLRMPQRATVLIVDDDETVRERLAVVVQAAGFDVQMANNGQEALAVLANEFASIVLTDRDMPEMDGLTFCRTVRQRNFPGYVYIMLLTVKDAEQDILAGLDAGADDYVSKRVSPAQLIARLRTAQRILSLEQSLRSVLEEKRREAMTDSLTGAHNRHYFTRHLTREIKRTKRFGGALAVLVLDIDYFKQVNDRYGHGIGDEVLQAFAARVRGALPREYDWCARMGGEEFAVVLPQTELPGAVVVAEKLRAVVGETPIPTTAGDLTITVSVGISSIAALPEGEELTADALVDLADRYLYKSKALGRNRVSAPLDADAVRRRAAVR